ncbi:MAG: Cna B-type domain-containing protein [Anaerovoracaceae bacterium]
MTSALLDNNNVDAKIAPVKYSGNNDRGDQTYNDANVVTQWTDAKNTINSGIDSLKADGGTNCQAGLYEARTKVLNSARSDAQKIVIFMSDGEPTFYYDSNGKTMGAGSADGDGYDWGGNIINEGSCSSAAYTEAEKITDIDAFYSIGISLAANETFLKNLIQKPAKGKTITREYYLATDTSALQKAFEDIAAQVTEFNYSNVSITDKLSQYVDIVGDDPVLTVKVTDKNGNPVAGNEGLTASYDSASKSVKLIFPEGYTLKDGYTYSVEFDVKPSQEAEKYFDSNDSYPNTGDEGTDWDDNNRISAGQKGLYSNDNDGTELKYTYKEKDYTDKYRKPVIKVSPKTDISGTKRWVDDSNKDNTRPDRITLKLYRNIKGGDKTEVTGVTPTWTKDGNTWTYEYKDLPKTDADGNVYTYTVKEELAATSPYEAKYDGNNITNSLKSGTTDFSGEKVWKDSDGKPIDNSKLPASIEIELLQNGESMTPVQKQTVTPGADNKWAYKFENLPKYDKDGKRYQYSIKELSVNGYQSSVTTAGEMTNQYNGGESVMLKERSMG